MTEELKDRIRARRIDDPCSAAFFDRLLEGIDLIEQRFEGSQREALLELIRAALDRQQRLHQNAREAHNALDRLQQAEQRLNELTGFLMNRREGETLH